VNANTIQAIELIAVNAVRLQRVLVTSDTDFLILAASGVDHFGIVFGAQESHRIGDWVSALDL
jgi:predicted nuclease of predicted toxin-antitoxin system